MHSPDLVAGNIEKIAALFPNCITEAKDATGKLTRGVDFDLLRQELSGSVVEGPQERYRLDWPGKREALLSANAPIAKTLRPCREESVDFNTTKNLFIEGDNLDALKLMQEAYLSKIDLILIDPPYNTGRDFLYNDKYVEDTKTHLLNTNQADETNARLHVNTDANGRFHSSWMSMLAPRLKLAKNLLKSSGSIFIFIDENELPNLWLVCLEIFGRENFIECFVYDKKAAAKGVPPTNMVCGVHEYILGFSKSPTFKMVGIPRPLDGFSNPDNDPRGPWRNTNCKSTVNDRSSAFAVYNPKTGSSFTDTWAHSKEEMERMATDGTLIFPQSSSGQVRKKEYYREFKNANTPVKSSLGLYDAQSNTEELTQLMGEKVFPNPKHIRLIKDLLAYTLPHDGIVFDFFGGSCTTADALMRLNSEDGGSRRYIIAQIAEPCDIDSNAYRNGWKTIAEVGKERIRRAGNQLNLGKCDTGFRVMKVDASNFEPLDMQPDDQHQQSLLAAVDNIRKDRTPDDLLIQVMLDWGVDLGLPIISEKIAGKTVFFVDGNALAACFDTDISEELVTALAKRRLHDLPLLKVVFRDAGYASDSAKINVEQIFKLLSPTTELRTL